MTSGSNNNKKGSMFGRDEFNALLGGEDGISEILTRRTVPTSQSVGTSLKNKKNHKDIADMSVEETAAMILQQQHKQKPSTATTSRLRASSNQPREYQRLLQEQQQQQQAQIQQPSNVEKQSTRNYATASTSTSTFTTNDVKYNDNDEDHVIDIETSQQLIPQRRKKATPMIIELGTTAAKQRQRQQEVVKSKSKIDDNRYDSDTSDSSIERRTQQNDDHHHHRRRQEQQADDISDNSSSDDSSVDQRRSRAIQKRKEQHQQVQQQQEENANEDVLANGGRSIETDHSSSNTNNVFVVDHKKQQQQQGDDDGFKLVQQQQAPSTQTFIPNSHKACRIMHEKTTNDSTSEDDENDDDDSSEEDTASDDDDDENESDVVKPMFVPKHKRNIIQAIQEERLQQCDNEQREKEEKERHKRESRVMVQQNIMNAKLDHTNKNDNDNMIDGISGAINDIPDDTDHDKNDNEDITSYDEWEVRELERIICAWEIEQERVNEEQERTLRRRKYTPKDLNDDDEINYTNERRDIKTNETKGVGGQKFFHRGAFYMDDDTIRTKATEYAKSVVLGDHQHRDVKVLPKIMQVKKFGIANQSKYKGLHAEDTTDKSLDILPIASTKKPKRS
jgi:microfibrillar-associated protein 1